MLSEVENRIGRAEHTFDLAKAKLEKIIIAIEEAELRGAPPQKLLFDAEAATLDLSAAIEELNAAYPLRDSKQAPRPPVENYIELFRKNAATKRAALASAREEEAQAAAKTTYDSAIRASAPRIVPVVPRRFEPEPPARPATCSLQDVIDEVEGRLNKALCEFDYLDLKIRSQKLARMAENISARAKANIDLTLADLDPPYEKKKNEVAELRALHKQMMAQRSDAKKAAGKS